MSVTITQEGVALWQGSVGLQPTSVMVQVQVRPGLTRIDFSSDQPGVRESPEPDSRTLAFALYDLQIAPVYRTP